ncbi:MAG TPA: MFS transporter [Acidimicrobiia bacterium]
METLPGTKSAAASRWGKYGRRPVWILALVAFIDSVDRGILPGVLTKVQDELGFSDFQGGVLGTAFIIAGFVAVLPAGYLADRYRRTRIIAVVLASWGAISALNAAVRNFGQFLAVRAMLGIGETVDNPSSQSLLADYYPATLRGRAYALQRVAPLLGVAVGTGVGGGVAALLGWRWAFLLVGVPGSMLAVAAWRLPEPTRGEHDALVEPDMPVLSTTKPEREEAAVDAAVQAPASRGIGAMLHDARLVLQVRTLRSLIVGTAIAAGALSGLGFWSPAFYERHTSLSSGQASGVVAALILIGAIIGTIIGGRLTDRLRDRVEGAPMLVAGLSQAAGAAVLMVVYLDVPLTLRLVMSVVGVMLIVLGFPALTTMTSEVVPATIRGLAFSVTTFLSTMASALSPLLIGGIADQFEFMVDGEVKGNLANAFLIVTPLVFIGALVVLRGRSHVAADTQRAAEVAAEITSQQEGR